MRFSPNTLVAGLAAAGALAAGILLAPPTSSAQDDVRYLLSQEQNAGKDITVSGTALNPDGTPAVKIPVVLKMVSKTPAQSDPGGTSDAPAPELLQAKGAGGSKAKNSAQKEIGKGITDDSGRFSIKAKTLPMGKGDPAITVAIGDPVSSNWSLTTHVMKADKTELDVGNIQLKQKVR